MGKRPRGWAIVEDDTQDQSKAQGGEAAQCTDEGEHLQDAGMTHSVSATVAGLWRGWQTNRTGASVVPRCPIPGDASQLKSTQVWRKIDRLNVGVGPWVIIHFGSSRGSVMLQTTWALHSCLLTACQAFITALPSMLLIYIDHMRPSISLSYLLSPYGGISAEAKPVGLFP